MTDIRNCKAITKKGKACPWRVEPWREKDLCHIHDPQGTFRIQHPKKNRLERPNVSYKKEAYLSVIEEMLSKKCTQDPFIQKCLSQDSVHCDTIDFMIDIVSYNQRLVNKKKRA